MEIDKETQQKIQELQILERSIDELNLKLEEKGTST